MKETKEEHDARRNRKPAHATYDQQTTYNELQNTTKRTPRAYARESD